MKKNVILIITLIFIVVIFSITSYNKIKSEKNGILKFNLEYENYNKKDLNGLDIVTLINKTGLLVNNAISDLQDSKQKMSGLDLLLSVLSNQIKCFLHRLLTFDC